MSAVGHRRSRFSLIALAVIFLLLLPLKDTDPNRARKEYEHVRRLFEHGKLSDSQREAEKGYEAFEVSQPEWATRFELLEAESMEWRGMYNDVLHLLAGYRSDSNHPVETTRKLVIEAIALTHQQQLDTANQRLLQAESHCKTNACSIYGDLLQARGGLAANQGQLDVARKFYLESFSFAQAHHDRFLEARASLSLGWAALQIGHYDEAADWSRAAYRTAMDLNAEDLAQAALGNLGWAYYQLGDDENALDLFLHAEKTAAQLGDIRFELKWISNAGYIYHDTGDLVRAAQSYLQALNLAEQIDSKEDVMNALEDLAHVSVETGELNKASSYIDHVASMERAEGSRLNANILLTDGMLAAARHQDQQAEALFRALRKNLDDSTTIRLTSGDDLGELYEREGNIPQAEREYRSTLITFETARAQLKNDTSRLPFAANATNIYDDYIHLLVKEGRSEEALAAADQSRARTLAQGLGVKERGALFHPAALNPRAIARKVNATLLFYWLGEKQSYLWAVTPEKITLVELPPRAEIVIRVERYRETLLDMDDPLQERDDDGQALYRMLIAPVAKLLRRDGRVMILSDGALSRLNFETLLVPGPSPRAGQATGPAAPLHYLIDDATLLSAPSLAMLAAAEPERPARRSLLLIGNPVTPSPDYPSLPLFGAEMIRVASHFAAGSESVFAGPHATPDAYLSSDPARYAYIHFVAHATASQTDPLDSAIILSREKTDEDSFKLYAREIMKHSLDARLVTISACYGSGTRSYAGEGLVGLSWAFLRAGAHSVVGALWEVSDESTPRLMDTFYRDIEEGQAPAMALRSAKLSLLHTRSRFRAPFYWAPFQLYTRQ